MASSSLRGPGSRLDPEHPFHWATYVWSSILRPNQSCFSWRLLLRKTPTETLVQIKGVHHLASRCRLSRGYLETDVHLLFLYPSLPNCGNGSLVQLALLGLQIFQVSAHSLWSSLSTGCDAIARRGIGAVFLLNSYFLWKIRNDQIFGNPRLSINRAKL